MSFIMQTSGCINKHHIAVFCYSTLHSIKSNSSRIRTHGLFYNGNSNSFTPDGQLVNCCSTKSICSTQQHILSRLLKIISQLTNGCCFSNTIHTNHKNYIRFGR